MIGTATMVTFPVVLQPTAKPLLFWWSYLISYDGGETWIYKCGEEVITGLPFTTEDGLVIMKKDGYWGLSVSPNPGWLLTNVWLGLGDAFFDGKRVSRAGCMIGSNWHRDVNCPGFMRSVT